MIDIATAYGKYKFIGYEFLTWLWFTIETAPAAVAETGPIRGTAQIGSRIVLENPQMDRTERITAKGEKANFDTGMLSLQQGAFVTEISLLINAGGQEWQFVIKGDTLAVSNLKTPPTAPVEAPEDLEGAVLEKTFLVEQAMACIDHLFRTFIKQRLSSDWQVRRLAEISRWVRSRA